MRQFHLIIAVLVTLVGGHIIPAQAQQPDIDNYVRRTGDSTASPVERQMAYQAILKMDEHDCRSALRRIVGSEDQMFRASAASRLWRDGDRDDAMLVVSRVSQWSNDEQLVLLQGLPIVGPVSNESTELARAVMQSGLEPRREAPEPGHSSALGAAAIFLANHDATPVDVELVERAIRSHPRQYGLWMALGLIDGEHSLHELADELCSNDNEALEVRISAGLTLAPTAPGHQWAQQALRGFIEKYKGIEFPAPGSEPAPIVKEFVKEIRVVGLLQVFCKQNESESLVELLGATNTVIRDVAGIALTLHAPETLLEADDLRLGAAEIEKLGALFAVSHPDMRASFERKLGTTIDESTASDLQRRSLSQFGLAGGIIAGR